MDEKDGLTHPALVADALGALATQTDTNNVGRRVEQTLGQVDELLVLHLLDELVNSHGVDQLAVADSGAIAQSDNLIVGVDLGDLTLLAKDLLLLGQSLGHGDPDTTGTVTGREAESGVGAPVAGDLVQDDVADGVLDVGGSDTLAEPLALHLGGGDSPHLVVVGAHEDVGDTLAGHANNPLVKVGGLGVGDAALESGVNEAVNALDLVLLGQDGDVVLEGVGDPELLVADVGDALVGVPVLLLGKGLVEAVVKVLVVGEDNVTADIVEL